MADPPGDLAQVVVPVVLAHPRQRVHDRDVVFAQQVRLPDSGQLQELRRLHRPGGEDHFAPRAHLRRRAPPARAGP